MGRPKSKVTEKQVGTLLKEGYNIEQIACMLGVSRQTIRTRIGRKKDILTQMKCNKTMLNGKVQDERKRTPGELLVEYERQAIQEVVSYYLIRKDYADDSKELRRVEKILEKVPFGFKELDNYFEHF